MGALRPTTQAVILWLEQGVALASMMDDRIPDGLPFLEICWNGKDVQVTEHVRCASAHNDPGTSTVLCLQLILIQCGETAACSLDCGDVLRFFISLTRESSTLALTANAM